VCDYQRPIHRSSIGNSHCANSNGFHEKARIENEMIIIPQKAMKAKEKLRKHTYLLSDWKELDLVDIPSMLEA